MELSQILSYVLALGVAAAIPGPGMTALVARTVGSGVTAGFAMLLGLILGDLTYLTFAVFGLAVVAKSFAGVFVAVKWFSILYLVYLGWQFWHSEKQDITASENTRRDQITSAIAGFTITLGNPKTIAFYLALLPIVIDLHQVTFSTWASVLVPLTVLVLLVVGAVFVLGAHAVRVKLSSERAQRNLNRGAAVAMMGAAGSMAYRTLDS